MSEQELKPCPFCGADAVRHPQLSHLVTCSNTECEIQGHYFHEKVWNNRSSPPEAVVGEAEKLREATLLLNAVYEWNSYGSTGNYSMPRGVGSWSNLIQRIERGGFVLEDNLSSPNTEKGER